MNALDALQQELRKPGEAGGDADAIWLRARLDALLDRDQRAAHAFEWLELLAADGAIAALVLPMGWHVALLAAMVAHVAGTMWMTTQSV